MREGGREARKWEKERENFYAPYLGAAETFLQLPVRSCRKVSAAICLGAIETSRNLNSHLDVKLPHLFRVPPSKLHHHVSFELVHLRPSPPRHLSPR